MRYWVGGAAIAGNGGRTSRWLRERLELEGILERGHHRRGGAAGNGCAVRGHATNTGNRRARVRITYDAKNSGNVIAPSVAEVEVAPFSNFDFANNVVNSQGQPSSGTFVPPVSCAAIDDISRRDLDVEAEPRSRPGRRASRGAQRVGPTSTLRRDRSGAPSTPWR